MSLRFLVAAPFAFAATGLLFGCGGQQASAVPPVGTAARSASRTGPLAHGAGRKLLYVVTNPNVSVGVYTYPYGLLVGTLPVPANNLCTDQQGDVFVSSIMAYTVTEYAHGSVIPKLTLPGSGACSVDPSTGSLAAVPGSTTVIVFPYNKKKGWRLAKVYRISNMDYARFCTYDPNGNLFVDGDANSNFDVVLDELPKGGKAFEPISLDRRLRAPGGLQWVGNYLALATGGPRGRGTVVIYQYAISGSSGTEIGSTRLFHSFSGAQYWIQGGRVIGQYVTPSFNGFAFWRYPRGGKPLKTFAPQMQAASTVVSLP